MEQVKQIFKNTGDLVNNDVILEQLFPLKEHAYKFIIRPKTPFWRLGIRISRTEKIVFNLETERHKNKSFTDVFLAAGEWDLKTLSKPGRLQLEQSNFDLGGGSAGNYILNRCDSYIEKSEVEWELRYEAGLKLLVICVNGGSCDAHETYIPVTDEKYFKVFAWADKHPFELETIIETKSINEAKYNKQVKHPQSIAVGKTMFRFGDMFDAAAFRLTDTFILPASVGGDARDFVLENAKKLRIPFPGGGKAGELELHQATDVYGLRRIQAAYAYTVTGRSSDITIVAAICHRLTSDSSYREGSVINLPLLGTGAGNLDPISVVELYLNEFNSQSEKCFIVSIADAGLFYKIWKTLVARYELSRMAMSLIENEKAAKTETLSLENCNLNYIPDDLLNMPWLRELSLANNEIKKIENLENLTQLKVLNLKKNRIEKIENLQHLSTLQHLDLSNNKLTRPVNLESLTNLAYLDLEQNKIDSIEALGKNRALEMLGLSSNKLDNLNGLQQLTSLKTLYAGHNSITDLSPLQGLTKLERVVLSNNKIQSLRPLLPLIKRDIPVGLKYSFDKNEKGIFLLDNSNIAEPSIETVSRGNAAIIKYFDDLDLHGYEKFEIIKLILVGNSRVGKTNFSEFLRNGKITPNSGSTHLLAINEWMVNLDNAEESVHSYVNIFDFGGQDYYHDSHRLYYSHDTAYILMWDAATNKYNKATDNNEQGLQYENYPLEYWLESINYNLAHIKTAVQTELNQTSTALPSILVLQNKIDIEEGKLNQSELSARYKNIWGYFNCSLEQKKRTGVLHEVIKEYLNSLNLYGRKLITFEIKIVKHYLKKVDLKIMSLADFHEECKAIINDPATEFNLQNADIIAQILNNVGLVFYSKTSDTDGKVYTNIQYLNDTIKQIMDVAKRGNDKGIFRTEQVNHIPYYDEALSLLCTNKSIIKIDKSYIAPQFLPLEPDAIKFFLPTFTFTQMRYVYKAYFHKTLLLNIFAKHVKVDDVDNIKNYPFWRNGIVVSRGGDNNREMVFIEFIKNETHGIVNIKTMQPFSKAGLEKDIENELDALNIGWTVEKEISVNNKDFFNVSNLHRQVAEKQFEFYSNKNIFSVNEFKHIVDFKYLPKKLFISYSSKNASFIKRFITHLEILKSKGWIEPWYDRMIDSGTRWNEAIRKEMKNSDVIIFLLSPDFIATEYIMQTEIPLAIEQLKNEKSKFFFIELQQCSWKRTDLADFQQTDDSTETSKNIITIKDPENDENWMKVIDELEPKVKPGC